MERYTAKCNVTIELRSENETTVNDIFDELCNLGGKWTKDKDDNGYLINGACSGIYEYYPGCRYRSNGDPGDPDEEYYDIDFMEDDVDSLVSDLCSQYDDIDYYYVSGDTEICDD